MDTDALAAWVISGGTVGSALRTLTAPYNCVTLEGLSDPVGYTATDHCCKSTDQEVKNA